MRKLLFSVGLFVLLFPSAVFSQHMEMSKERVYECRTWMTVTPSDPLYSPIKVEIITPRPPDLPHQRFISQQYYVEGIGWLKDKAEKDLGALSHPVLAAEAAVPPGTFPGPEKYLIVTRVAVRSRWLAQGRAPAGSTIPVLSAEERLRYLAASDIYDYTTPAFDNWLGQSGAEKTDRETTLAYAQRVLSGVKEMIECRQPTDSITSAVHTLSHRSGVCRDFCALYVAILRAEGVPARMLVGRKLIDGRLDQTLHSEVELWIEKVGWVPCDPTFGTFGSEEGFLTLHLDPGFVFAGSQKMDFFALPWYVTSGYGTVTYTTDYNCTIK